MDAAVVAIHSISKMAASEEDVVNLVVKWSGKEYTFENLQKSQTVADFKQMIFDKTMVLPERQKLLGLKYKGEENLLCKTTPPS